MFQMWNRNVGVLLNNKTPQSVHLQLVASVFAVSQDVVRKQRPPLSGCQKLAFQRTRILLICTHENHLIS